MCVHQIYVSRADSASSKSIVICVCMEGMKVGKAGIIKSTLDDGKIKSFSPSCCDIPSTMPEYRSYTMGFVTDTLNLAGESKVLVDDDIQISDSWYRHNLLDFAL